MAKAIPKARKEKVEMPGVGVDAQVLEDLGHQLRNPLNAILGAASLLVGGEGTPEQHELARIIESGAEQLSKLLDEVLDTSSIQSGKLELALHPFDVRASVESCLARVAEAAGEKAVDLEFAIEPSVPGIVIGDSSRLEQVLLTLIRAGVARTERGGVGVELVSTAGDQSRLELTFRVRDTGAKIPAAALKHAMTGTGSLSGVAPEDRLWALTLVNCRRLVELMDGRLWWEPLRDGEDGPTEFAFTVLTEAVPASLWNAQVSLDGMRLLVVAADNSERRILTLQAELWGAFAVAAKPIEAIAQLQSGTPIDIAVIEHRRPAIDGLEVARAVRALRSPLQLPIVLLAASSPGEAEADAADSGLVQATLTKPFSADKLHDVLAQVGGIGAVAPSAPKPAEAKATPGALHVLVAEDNVLNQNMMRKLVSRLGHKVEIVANGIEAVAAVAENSYDAVLMDILMPEMDGLEAARAICRQWPRGSRPRLIALTALARPGDREKCLEAGMDDYMSKPVHLEELRLTLEQAAGWRTTPASTNDSLRET